MRFEISLRTATISIDLPDYVVDDGFLSFDLALGLADCSFDSLKDSLASLNTYWRRLSRSQTQS